MCRCAELKRDTIYVRGYVYTNIYIHGYIHIYLSTCFWLVAACWCFIQARSLQNDRALCVVCTRCLHHIQCFFAIIITHTTPSSSSSLPMHRGRWRHVVRQRVAARRSSASSCCHARALTAAQHGRRVQSRQNLQQNRAATSVCAPKPGRTKLDITWHFDTNPTASYLHISAYVKTHSGYRHALVRELIATECRSSPLLWGPPCNVLCPYRL